MIFSTGGTRERRRPGTYIDIRRAKGGTMRNQLFGLQALLMGVSGFSIASPACAQEQAVATPAAEAGVGDIIVTATRTSESINRVPISITALSQQTIDTKGIKSIEDMSRFTPGIRFDQGNNRVIIRGIASNAGAGTTGIYIDETPIQIRALRYGADDAVPAVFDLERVEVLRGPQGTLFGAGSEGGTVRYITPQPGLTEYSVYARSEVSRTEHGGLGYEAGGAVGGPIVSDVLGFRINAYHRRAAGWIERVDNQTGDIVGRNTNSSTTTALAASLAWAPAENIRVTPSIRYQRRNVDDLGQYYVALSRPQDGVFRNSSPTPRDGQDRFYLAGLNVKVGLGAVDLISNTSYFKRTNIANGYDGTIYNLGIFQFSLGAGCTGCRNDLYPLVTATGANKALPYYYAVGQVTNRQRNITQEVRLQSNTSGSRLSWVAGAFYQRSKQYSNDLLYDPNPDSLFPFVFGQTYEQFYGMPLLRGAYDYDAPLNSTDEQLAAFASATYEVLDGLKLTAGMRYARTKYSFTSVADGTANAGYSESAGKSKESPFSPRLNATYEFDRDNLVYATWAKGFRAGGANAPLPADACAADLAILGISGTPDGYDSDEVSSVEVGMKNRLLNGRLTLAGSLFNVRWTGIQQTINLPTCGLGFIGNLGRARSRGFDVQASVAPVNGLTLDLSVGYTQTRYTEDVRTGPRSLVVAKGDAIEGPPWTVAIGGQYDFALIGDTSFVRVDYQHASELKVPTLATDPRTTGYNRNNRTPSATNFVSVRTGMIVDGVNASIFVDNVFDTSPRLRRSRTGILLIEETWRPRTIGMTLTYRM